MLNQLRGWLLQDVSRFGQRDEQRAARLALLRARFRNFLRVHIHQRDRGLGTIEFRIASRNQNYLTVPGKKVYRFPVPKRPQRSG